MAAKSKSNHAKVATPRGSRNLSIRFGIVSIGVSIGPLVRDDERVSANNICAKHMSKVKQRWYCEAGDHYVDPIKGYDYAGQYVVLSEAEAEDFEALGDGSIELEACMDAAAIDPIYFDTSYAIWPSEGQESQYDLILHALRGGNSALVGEVVIGGKTRTFVIRYSAHTETLVAHTCYPGSHVRWESVALVRDAAEARPAPSSDYMALVDTILAKLGDDFDPATTTDTLADRKREYIAAKAAGAVPVKEDAPASPENTMPDLMAALRESIAAMEAKEAAA